MSSPGVLMMLASIGSKTLQTRTFTSSETYTIPAGVTRLESASGKGQDGTAATTAPAGPALACIVTYRTSGGGGTPGNPQWGTANSYANSARDAINAGGNGSYQVGQIDQFSNGSYNLSTPTANFTNAVAGSATLAYDPGWKTSGGIDASSQASVSWRTNVPPTTGGAATGFGLTFPGGVAGPAGTSDFGPQTVTPGATMSIVVPSGASITITYYA